MDSRLPCFVCWDRTRKNTTPLQLDKILFPVRYWLVGNRDTVQHSSEELEQD